MPSPFPGMDPFIERQEWSDFHATFITVLRELLVPRVEPRYVVRVERRVYVEHAPDEDGRPLVSDLAVLKDPQGASRAATSESVESVAVVEGILPMPQERRESFLVIRERETLEVVTVIELLSPGNKRSGSDGRREYLAKREAVLASDSHLVEIDLLRGGLRLPMVTPLPEADYYVIVSRKQTRPRARIHAWPLARPIPTIHVPLLRDDPDVPVDLQAALGMVYERARYDLSIDYTAELSPALDAAGEEWLRNVLAGGAGRS